MTNYIRIYRVTCDAHIEAHNAAAALDSLEADNGVPEIVRYFLDRSEAEAAFNALRDEAHDPYPLNGRLSWFYGVLLDSVDIDPGDATGDLVQDYRAGCPDGIVAAYVRG